MEPPLLPRQQPKTALEPQLLPRQQPKSALEPPLLPRQQPKSALEPPAKPPVIIKKPMTVEQQVEQTQTANTENQHQNVEKIVPKKKMTKTEFLEQRFEKLYAEFQRQNAAGIYEPQKDKNCAITIRKNELSFFQGENPPRLRGSFQCRICDREKRAMLRHNPAILLDGDSLITCFMCSEPLGWVYYCPYCAMRNR